MLVEASVNATCHEASPLGTYHCLPAELQGLPLLGVDRRQHLGSSPPPEAVTLKLDPASTFTAMDTDVRDPVVALSLAPCSHSMSRHVAAIAGATVTASSDLQRLKVFISYSRKDGDFADDLLLALKACGFAPFLDKRDIVPGEPWEERLDRLIQSSDTVVYVVSPDSVISERCGWEIKRTEELGKRLIPAVWRDTDEKQTPDGLKRLNYVFFTGDNKTFATGLSDLAEALTTDIGWIREHTAFGELANRWQQKDRADALLLRGEEIANAKAWSARRPNNAPEPTLLQREFFAASETAEQTRIADEAARAAAMKNAEIDRVRAEQEADKLRLVVLEKQRRLTFVVLAASILAVAIGGAALWQRLHFADERRQNAERLREITEKLAQVTVAAAAGQKTDDEARRDPLLSDAALDLIIAYEVGNSAEYAARGGKPWWPGAASGVVIGMGYDLGYYTPDEFRADWGDKLAPDAFERLAKTLGVKGEPAQGLIPELADISIPRDTAITVLRNRTLGRYAKQVIDTFPNARELPPDAFGALVSLVYNRGASLAGERRQEMANIRDLMQKREFAAVPEQLRAMKRLWPDMANLQQRREAEALLFEKGLLQSQQAG